MKKSKLKKRILELEEDLRYMTNKEEMSREWFERERKMCIQYAEEIEYKNKLLKNIISL